jgi:hypothetical protein
VLDKNNRPVENVNVSYSSIGTQTNKKWFYDLKVPANQNITIIFYTHLFKENNYYFSLDSNEQKRV